ncbi:hypothetical protein FLL45_17755 [Aliikangiella marina]|uniref:Uncharacterized protein n=1 Tax=Aliikangiella marina TaxID=1712262 RepID=A0A545T4B2_9GAMM|nr:hypothetical protein [Aliikangiella marina]TQV72014.1 hypothetical protein FLL45_17475 [Aliikangiella marina]TQV72067.1 hypothetical protein FLL45_17755 [Aliikangiella marina]
MKLFDCHYYLHTPVQIWARTQDYRPVIIYFAKGELSVDVGLPNEDHDTFDDLFEIFNAPVNSDYNDDDFISIERIKEICHSIDEVTLLAKIEKQIEEYHHQWITNFDAVKQYQTAFGPLFTLTIGNNIPWKTPYINRVGKPHWEAKFSDHFGSGLYLYFYRQTDKQKVKFCLFKNLHAEAIKPLELIKKISVVYGATRFGAGGAGRSEQICQSDYLDPHKTESTINLLIDELNKIANH